MRLFHDALSLRYALAVQEGIIDCVEGIAAIAASRGNAVAAAKLLAAADAYRAKIGAVPPYIERNLIEAARAAVKARLESSEIDESTCAGATMSLDEAALDALRLLKPPAAAAPLDVQEKLSAREREVFVLLSEYKTDREIAERLFLSHRTVERHVGSILAKLEVKNRREAAALGALRRAS
jgi:DNA-binding NarL/FixJ family response regulator